MIPRRLYEHVRTHNWFAVAVDFIIVVVGVFVGMQVSNWNADRLERRSARNYIERIREDISNSELTLKGEVAFYRKVEWHAIAALESFDKSKGELDETFFINAWRAAYRTARAIDRSTYDEMLSTGRMNSIPNTEIRRRLANYYRNVATIEENLRETSPYRNNLVRLMPLPAQRAMFNRCALGFSVDSHGRALVSFPERCELELSQEVIASAVAEIQNPELKGDLLRRVAELDSRLKVYQRLIDQGKSLDAFLAETKF